MHSGAAALQFGKRALREDLLAQILAAEGNREAAKLEFEECCANIRSRRRRPWPGIHLPASRSRHRDGNSDTALLLQSLLLP